MRVTTISAAAVTLFAGAAVAQPIDFHWIGTDPLPFPGLWSEPLNWDQGSVPSPKDSPHHVYIDNGEWCNARGILFIDGAEFHLVNGGYTGVFANGTSYSGITMNGGDAYFEGGESTIQFLTQNAEPGDPARCELGATDLTLVGAGTPMNDAAGSFWYLNFSATSTGSLTLANKDIIHLEDLILIHGRIQLEDTWLSSVNEPVNGANFIIEELNGAGQPGVRLSIEGATGGCPCACEVDTTTGPGVCDIFDFLGFQNAFVGGEACACDIDTTTGPGVCDIFDFLAFQDEFVGGCP